MATRTSEDEYYQTWDREDSWNSGRWKRGIAEKARQGIPFKTVKEYIGSKFPKGKFEKKFGEGSSEQYCDQIINDIERHFNHFKTALEQEQTHFYIGKKRHETRYDKESGLVTLETNLDSLERSDPYERERQELLDYLDTLSSVRRFIFAIDELPFGRMVWYCFGEGHIIPAKVIHDNGRYWFQSKKNYRPSK